MATKVRKRRNGTTRISSKNQVTIPVDALRRAGLKAGDELRVESARAGRVVFARDTNPLLKYAGALTGVFKPGDLEKLRNEWR